MSDEINSSGAVDDRPWGRADLATALSGLPEKTVRTTSGAVVRVRALTAGQVGQVGQMATGGQRMLAPTIFCWCVIDEDGNRLFTDKDVAEVSGWRGSDVTEVAEAVLGLTGLDDPTGATAQGN